MFEPDGGRSTRPPGGPHPLVILGSIGAVIAMLVAFVLIFVLIGAAAALVVWSYHAVTGFLP